MPILPQGVVYDPVDPSNVEGQRPSLGFRFKFPHRRPETPPPDPLGISEIDKPADCPVVPAPTITALDLNKGSLIMPLLRVRRGRIP